MEKRVRDWPIAVIIEGNECGLDCQFAEDNWNEEPNMTQSDRACILFMVTTKHARENKITGDDFYFRCPKCLEVFGE